MDLSLLQRQSDIEWVIAPFGKMRVPAILYASKSLIHDIDPKVYEDEHVIDGQARRLFVHRKGATRAFGPGHPDIPAALRRSRPTGADRRHHGHRVIRPRRHGREHEPGVWLRLPWCRPQYESSSGTQTVARARGGRRPGQPRHSHPQPLPARRRRGGPWRVQGCAVPSWRPRMPRTWPGRSHGWNRASASRAKGRAPAIGPGRPRKSHPMDSGNGGAVGDSPLASSAKSVALDRNAATSVEERRRWRCSILRP